MLNQWKLSALQIPIQIRRSGHQNHSRHLAALFVRSLALQSRQLLVGQPSNFLAPLSQGMGVGDGGETRLKTCFRSVVLKLILLRN